MEGNVLAKQLCTQAKEIHSQATKASGLTRSDIQQTWTTAAGLELRLAQSGKEATAADDENLQQNKSWGDARRLGFYLQRHMGAYMRCGRTELLLE